MLHQLTNEFSLSSLKKAIQEKKSLRFKNNSPTETDF